jgi:hypothetical protein
MPAAVLRGRHFFIPESNITPPGALGALMVWPACKGRWYTSRVTGRLAVTMMRSVELALTRVTCQLANRAGMFSYT